MDENLTEFPVTSEVPADTQHLLLNGFRLSLSSQTFSANTLPLPDNKSVRYLRREHPDWFLYWRDGTLYAIPRVDSPSTSIGKNGPLSCDDHLQLVAALIDEALPKKFPAYTAFRRRPFAFIGRKQDEIVSIISKRLRSVPKLLHNFTIRPAVTLEAKIIEPTPDGSSIGLFLTVNTKWEVGADLRDLQAAGVNLEGLCVVRRDTGPDERRLVGQIQSVDRGVVYLALAYNDRKSINLDQVLLEGSKASFARCLRALLGHEYELYEQTRQQEEGKLLSGPAVNSLLQEFQRFFRKDPGLSLTKDLAVTIHEQIAVANNHEYEAIHQLPPVQYYFNPARTKASPYPWVGINRYGPFSKDTFPKRTPNILVVFPDTIQGATETFLNHLRSGITMASHPQYEGGFAKLFGLINPSFTRCKIPAVDMANPAAAYRNAIERHLAATTTTPDAAIVVLTDQHGALPDASSPYLSAKATLMLAGVPTQEIKLSKLTKPTYELQYILQNFAVALYAKMNGTPWTVNQDTTISDELVIGIGTDELSTNRFSERKRYVGITTVFRGDGSYLLGNVSRECEYKEYPKVLQETTEHVLQEIKQRNGWNPGDNVRLIFHTYKPLKNVEIADIAKRASLAVGSEQTIEFAFLTVTIDHTFLLMDPQQHGVHTKHGIKAVLVPERGVIMQLGRYTRLVCTNGPSLIKHENAPLPAPILVHIHKGSTFNDLTYLSEQALKFTGLSWRSVLPAKKPVSIHYSELIAGLLARLRSVEGWSPAVLNLKLRASRWFL